MNKRSLFSMVCGMMFLFLFGILPLLPQQEFEEQTEYTEVTNVELIVRAMFKGKAISGLKKSDFIILEDGEELKITSLTEVRRKIGEKVVESEPVTGKKEADIVRDKKRLFLLYFWISERELKYREALDYFFTKVYRKGDAALLKVKNQVFKVTVKEDISPALLWLQKLVIQIAAEFRSDRRHIVRFIENLFKEYKDELHKPFPNITKLKMLRQQLRFHLDSSWKQFQYKHLISNSKQLVDLAGVLKDVKHEKWGLVFYQENAFPHLDLYKIGDRLNRQGFQNETSKMRALITFFRLKTRLPDFSFFNLKNVKEAFANEETTFHVLWMDTKTNLEYESRNLEVGNVYSGWMETFIGISNVTGGEVIRANKLKESLERIVEREDIYYRITYAPAKRGKKNRKIKVQIKNKDKGIKVFHVNRIELTPRRGIGNLFHHSSLSLTVTPVTFLRLLLHIGGVQHAHHQHIPSANSQQFHNPVQHVQFPVGKILIHTGELH